jgi:hypothetical protein
MFGRSIILVVLKPKPDLSMKKILCISIITYFVVLTVKGQSLQDAFNGGATITANNKFINLNRGAANYHFGLQWQTNIVNDFFIGLRELGDRNFHIYNYGTLTDALTIKRDNGYIGMGIMNPQYNLQIQKTSAQPAIMIGGGFARSPRLQLYGLDADGNAWMGLGTDMDNGPYEHSIYFPSATTGRLTFGDYNGTTYNARMSILNNGNVGIGVKWPQSTLAVAGTITAKKVKVTAEDWPDYVFKQNYSLPTLQELENYVTTHHHLPGVPSATEVESNGLDLGEMNKQLLQKVEELTLYLISEHKKNIALEKTMAEINRRLESLECK